MKPALILLGVLVAGLAPPTSAQPGKLRELLQAHPWNADPELRFRRGDDPAWARPDFNDADWTRIDASELPAHDGPYWVRTRVTPAAPGADRAADAVAVAAVAAYELYWDGQLVGRSGTVGGSPATEVPGPLDQVFPLPPDRLAPGEHVVAIRLSSFHTGFSTPSYAMILGLTNQRDYFTARSRAAAFAVVAVGAGVVLGVLFLVIGFVVLRRLAPALFGLVCLSAAGVQALQMWRVLFHYTYDWHNVRLLGQIASVGVLGLLLVAFVAVFFRLPRPARWVSALAVVMIAVGYVNFDYVNPLLEMLWWSSLVLAAGLAAWALARGERRAGLVLLGLLASCTVLARNAIAFREQSFLQGLGPSLLGGMVALTLQLRADREAARRAQLTAARLEIELLKKNIQPHFLLNTLTTLTEVIETEPKTAVTLIEALAAEFRLLARLSGERLVPLRQELELCREHLRVMSLRHDVRYALRAEVADEEALVPPALFLTLVENGLTHARARAGAVEFLLRSSREGDTERHVFVAPGGAPAAEGRGAAGRASPAAGDDVVEGTGSRYVKARLEESFAGRWKFASGPSPLGWETVIEYRRTRLAVGIA